jgi:hypothetical protein
MTKPASFASYLIWDLITAHVMWACVLKAMQDGDYEAAAFFAHMLADLASA